jgi:hypothetical protein
MLNVLDALLLRLYCPLGGRVAWLPVWVREVKLCPLSWTVAVAERIERIELDEIYRREGAQS